MLLAGKEGPTILLPGERREGKPCADLEWKYTDMSCLIIGATLSY